MSTSHSAGLGLGGSHELARLDPDSGPEIERAPASAAKPASSSRREPSLPIGSRNKGEVSARRTQPAAGSPRKLALHAARASDASLAPLAARMPGLPALGPEQMKFLSSGLRDAYSSLQQVIKRNEGGEAGVDRRYVDALSRYVNLASDEVRHALAGSRQPVNPTWKTAALNVVAQLTGNLASFTTAAMVANVAQAKTAVGPYGIAAIQAGVLAATLPGAGVLNQFVGRKLGGTEAELRVSNDTYVNAAASLAKALVLVVPYGLTHAGLTWARPEFFNDTVMGGLVRSMVSATAFSGAQQSAEKRFAIEVRDTGSSRMQTAGFIHRRYAPWRESKTASMLAQRFALQTLSAMVGCAFVAGIAGTANEKLSDDPVKHSLVSVIGAFSVMFAAMHIVQMLGTFVAFDPKRNAARLAKHANAVLIDKLKASSNDATLAMVGNLRCAIANGIAGDEARRQLDADASVLNGDAFRRARHGHADGETAGPSREIVGFQARLNRVAAEIGERIGVASFNGQATGLIDAAFSDITRKLDSARESIDNARRNYLDRGNDTLHADLNHALQRLRDVLPSLMQCVTQAGGAGNLDYDPRIREVTQSVLPLLVVVDKVDLMEEADRFCSRLAQIPAGRTAASMLAELSAQLNKRGMADEIAARQRRTGSPDAAASMLATLERLLAGGKPDAVVSDPHKLLENDHALRVLILMNKLHPDAGDHGAQALNALIARFESLGTDTSGPAAIRAANVFVLAFKDGAFTLRQLKDQLLNRLDAEPDELVSRRTCETFRKLVGERFIGMASSEEVPADPTRDAIDDVRTRVGAISYDLLKTLWADMEGKPESRRDALKAIMSVPVQHDETVRDLTADGWQGWLDRLRSHPERIVAGNASSPGFIRDAFNAGRPAIVRADGGTPLDKVANDDALMHLLASLAVEARTPIGDPLDAVPGAGEVPARIVSVVIAQGDGGARKFGADHCARVASRVQHFRTLYPELRLRIDPAWRAIWHHVAEDLIDSFTRERISEPLVKAMQTVLDTYRSFAAVKSSADAADRAHLRDQASEGRSASEIVNALHTQSLDALNLVIDRELANPQTAAKIHTLMRAAPSRQTGSGNNWLGFFYELTDVLVFVPETQHAGASEPDMRSFEFMSRMFDAVARHYADDANLATVTSRIARQNFVDLVDDPLLAARRAFHDRHHQDVRAQRLPELHPLEPITLDFTRAGERSS